MNLPMKQHSFHMFAIWPFLRMLDGAATRFITRWDLSDIQDCEGSFTTRQSPQRKLSLCLTG